MKSTKPFLVYFFAMVTAILLFFASTEELQAQNLDYESMREVVLSDGTNLILFSEFSRGRVGGRTRKFHYLPSSNLIRLGRKVGDEDTPEFLFMKYTTEERQDQGGVQGALLHFLIEWGLTPSQEAELKSKVEDDLNGQLIGPVDLRATENESFRIVSGVLQDKDFTSTFITSGYAPPLPGAKAAVAAKLDKFGAQLLDATFQKTSSISDVSLVLDYEYTAKIKAARGKLTYDMRITQEQGDQMAYDFLKKELDNQPAKWEQAQKTYNEMLKNTDDGGCEIASGLGKMITAMAAHDAAVGNTTGSGDTGSPWEYGITEETMRKMYDYFEEESLIKLDWEENIDDERLTVFRDAFFDSFLSSFTDPTYPELGTFEQLNSDQVSAIDNNELNKNAEVAYSFKSCTQLNAERKIYKVIRLDNLILPIKRRFQMVTNLASTYDQVRDNPKCIASVNLNDPFFQHRDINFIMDLQAKEIFEEEINYVTVNVRKKRSAGNDFKDAVTMGMDYLDEKGSLATITYARGEDKNSDLYEYKTQWSLKGGNIYPEKPKWVKGDWQGVTLAAPIAPRRIEFEGDLDELSEMDIVRATLQLRYSKFGREIETNVPLTVSRDEPLVETTIYPDKETQGYVYRLILTHKEKGKLALPWDAKINDDYVYAQIPDELQDPTSEFFKKAIQAAKTIARPGPDGEVSEVNKILNQFADVMKVFVDGGN